MIHSAQPFELHEDPLIQFGRWFEDASNTHLEMPNAMTIATCDAEGIPNARMVLLKGYGQDGFRFFTNYSSVKGEELAHNPHVSAVFWWEPLLRQVRIRGQAHKLSDQDSDAYFQTRSRDSRIGAWASKQSQIIADRADLETEVTKYRSQYSEGFVPRPAYWGGFLIDPFEIEFWQERPFRLHDRMRYRRVKGQWIRERLNP